MNLVEYLEQIPTLTSAARTVSAQLVSPDDNGLLKYTTYFTPTDVNSTKIGDIQIGNYRPVASRREWNGPGRLIPHKTPDIRDVEFVPIESYFTLGEREIQKLEEYTDGDEAAILRRMGADVESRTDGLAEANYRRVEYDAFNLWARGKVIQDDPTTGKTVETDLNYGADRITTEMTPWDNTNAYDNLIAWLDDAKGAIGTVEGVMLSGLKLKLIRESAPTLADGRKLKLSELEAEIEDEIGSIFRFVTNDDTADHFIDGGIDTENRRNWPQKVIAAIPAGGVIGIAARAPVARAAQISRNFPEARVDRRGVAVYYISQNEGKGAKVAAQLNHFCLPAKQKVFTNDIG